VLLDRQAFENGIERFCDLFAAAFGRVPDRDAVVWRYLRNPLANEFYVNVEDGDGCLLANYSASPLEMHVPGAENVLALLSMTTMTHPSAKGRGLFPQLAGALYEKAAIAGNLGVFGFPNANSHFPFKAKLGWTDIYEIPTFSCQVPRETPVELHDSIAVRADAFDFDPLAPDWLLSHLHVRRTRQYLNWRYLDNPAHDYQCWIVRHESGACSYCVTKHFDRQLDLVDFVPASVEVARAFLQAVFSYARSRSLDQVSAWSQPHFPYRGEFERLGFRNAAPVTYFGGRVFNRPETGLNIFDYKNWFVQMGDSDIY
jgi:hypothetical protein